MFLMLASTNDTPDKVAIYNTDDDFDRGCLFTNLVELDDARVDRVNDHEWFVHHSMKLEPVKFKLSRAGDEVVSIDFFDKYNFHLLSISSMVEDEVYTTYTIDNKWK